MSMDDEVTRLPGGVEGGALLRVGQRFGSYEVLRLLGRGGMGEVYAVRHGVLGTEHALKLIKREISAQPGARRRFQDEARAMARLVHPGIVHVDDFGETEGLTWLRMEWVGRWESGKVGKSGGGGSSLEEKLEAKSPSGKLNEAEVRGIIGAILKALAYAHGEGLVHRDLKPANILLHADGTVKISDFGLVRMVGEQWLNSQVQQSVARSMSMSDKETVGPSGASGSGGTSSKALLGTYAYMSPEQKEGGEVDHRSDLYAVGLMAFQMLTGEKTVGLEMPSDIRPELDADWDVWMKRAIAGNADRRFASAEAMLEALPGAIVAKSAFEALAPEKVELSQPVLEVRRPEPTVGEQPVPNERKSPGSSSRGLGGRALVIFFLVVGVTAGLLWLSEQQSQPPSRSTATVSPPSADRPAAVEGTRPAPRPTVAARGGPVPGQNAEVELPGGVKVELMWIRPGEFMMGSPNTEAGRWDDEGPQTSVRLTRGFWLGKYPVTVGEFRAFAESSGYRTEAERNPSSGMRVFEGGSWRDGPNRSWRTEFSDNDRNPVVGVSWNDAKEFARWLTERERAAGRLPEGYEYTLPSEAQWEYACRAGTTTRFNLGNSDSDLGRAGWFSGNAQGRTHAVGQKTPNAWGLYDMHGNVWEWTRTCYWYGSYPGGSVVDYEGPSSGSLRVYRGGSWSDSARYCRSAVRDGGPPDVRGVSLGFRLALSSVP
jgi:sulfatase modifying factor 1